MIRRFYRCTACDHKFDVVCEKRDPDPECPNCAIVADRDDTTEAANDEARLQRMLESGTPPGVIGVKAKAIDMAQRMAEEDYGLTDMNDNSRAGDTAFKPESPMTTAEATAKAKEMMEAVVGAGGVAQTPDSIRAIGYDADPNRAFWAGSGSVQGERPAGPVGNATGTVQASASHAKEARDAGNDPIAKLHEAGKAGKLPNNYQVMAKAKMPTESNL